MVKRNKQIHRPREPYFLFQLLSISPPSETATDPQPHTTSLLSHNIRSITIPFRHLYSWALFFAMPLAPRRRAENGFVPSAPASIRRRRPRPVPDNIVPDVIPDTFSGNDNAGDDNQPNRMATDPSRSAPSDSIAAPPSSTTARDSSPMRSVAAYCRRFLLVIVVVIVVVGRQRQPQPSLGEGGDACSIGHPPHSSASPVELRLRVGPRALSEKKRT